MFEVRISEECARPRGFIFLLIAEIPLNPIPPPSRLCSVIHSLSIFLPFLPPCNLSRQHRSRFARPETSVSLKSPSSAASAPLLPSRVRPAVDLLGPGRDWGRRSRSRSRCVILPADCFRSIHPRRSLFCDFCRHTHGASEIVSSPPTISSTPPLSSPLSPPLFFLDEIDATAGSICFGAVISVNDPGRGHENIRAAIPFPLTPSFPLSLPLCSIGGRFRKSPNGRGRGTGRSSVSRHSRCTLTTLLCFITLHQMLP